MQQSRVADCCRKVVFKNKRAEDLIIQGPKEVDDNILLLSYYLKNVNTID